MTWHGAADFFAMGGYGVYVWGAYGVTALCMAVEPALAAMRHAQARRSVAGQGHGHDGHGARR